MSDTPTQAAALPKHLVEIDQDDYSTWGVVTVHAWDSDYAAELKMGAPLFTAGQLRDCVAQALAQQAQELDALRAALRWNDVRTDGFPPCDGEAVFVGINSAGYVGAFNVCSGGDCQMITAESYELVMGDLRYWRRHVGPATEGEANV